MSDDPVLKKIISYVSNGLLTRERLISAEKEELTFNRAGRKGSYLLFHERLSIDEKMATIRCHCVR
jgi:hypothetical protein